MPNERRSQGCYCQKYVDAISRIARLEEDVARLKRENAGLREQLGKARRTALEKPFGESTSSASRLVKPSAPEPVDEAERMRRVGGARHGHKGHGWKKLGEPRECVDVPAPGSCPHCGGELVDPPFDGDETRDVVVSYPVKAYVRRYRARAMYCRRCGRPVRTRIGGVMDGCRYANSVIARAATDFYLNGIPSGVVSRGLGVNKGTLLGAFARVSRILEAVRDKASEIISSSEFAQGDESRWRIDGRNGYAWVFIAGNLVVYVCADSRRSAVAKGVIGDFKGIFASDRYSGYEFVAGQRSFCLEHLKRDAIKVREDNPESKECSAYADAIVPVLAEIMKLRSVFGEDPKAYHRAALDAGRRLYEIVHREAKHPDIQKHQDVFRDTRLRTWQWLIGPEVPADNNRSEREVRPIAIARKVSHGSQSDTGADERGIFMSVLHTLKACGVNPAERLEHALDLYAEDNRTDMFDALFGGLDLNLPVLPRGAIRKLPKAITGK